MRNLYFKTLFVALVLFFNTHFLNAVENLSISKDFTIFTSKNLEGYLKPLFTTLEESLNSYSFTDANYQKEWSFAVDLSFMSLFIPDNQKNFNAERPQGYGNTDVTQTAEFRNGVLVYNATGNNQQPTIYGGLSTPIFSVPQHPQNSSYKYNGNSYLDSTIKSVAYVEGNKMNLMLGLPALQLIIGLPTQTQLRTRFLAAKLQGELFYYYGITVNQRIDDFMKLFHPADQMGWAFTGSFHNLHREGGIDIKAWSAGTFFSKGFGNDFTGYLGLQFEGINGQIKAVKDTSNMTNKINSPYPEVQFADPLVMNVESFNNFRVLSGISYKLGFFEIHGDLAYASQPVISLGFTFWFGHFGKKEQIEQIKIEKLIRNK